MTARRNSDPVHQQAAYRPGPGVVIPLPALGQSDTRAPLHTLHIRGIVSGLAQYPAAPEHLVMCASIRRPSRRANRVYSASWIHGRAFSPCACDSPAWLTVTCGHWLIVADERREWVLGDHGPPGAQAPRSPVLRGHVPPVPDARCTPRQAWQTLMARRAAQGRRALVFAVLARWRRIPSPSATASGSPNRLLCPNPVRYMSVNSGSAELTIAYCGCLHRRLERIADAGPVGCSRRSAWHKRTQHWSGGEEPTESENPARAHLPC
jgi:hypothetical protein